MSVSMGVRELHEQGRPKWISVRQNSLSYTFIKKALIIFSKKIKISNDMGVGEQHEQGRPKGISVQQNSLSYTLQKIDCTIFVKKLIKN